MSDLANPVRLGAGNTLVNIEFYSLPCSHVMMAPWIPQPRITIRLTRILFSTSGVDFNPVPGHAAYEQCPVAPGSNGIFGC